MKKFLAATLATGALLFAAPSVIAQYQVTTLGSAVVENFTDYAGTSAPANWSIVNAGNNIAIANTFYRGLDNGASNTSNAIRSYGSDGSSDRALGFLGSGSLVNFNASATFINSTGSTVTSFVISYLAEQWRSGAGTDPVSSTFTVAYSINGGSFSSLNDLAWTAPQNNPGGATNGDNPAFQAQLTQTISGISLAGGSNITFRWQYLRNAGTGEGLGIDNVSVTFNGGGATFGNYWSSAVGGGGTGVWSTDGTTWAVGPGGSESGSLQGTGTLLFGDAAGTVTVSGGVSASAGMQFTTTGYTLQSSTIALTGANATANTITTDTGVTATISSQLTGTAGMTKAGAGSLVLGGANTYTGTTTVSAGTLALDSSGSLASSVALATGTTLDLTAKASGYSLASGTTLRGTGTVTTAAGQALTVGSGATISPATATTSGTLTLDGLVFAGGGSYAFRAGNVTGTPGVNWDLISVNNNFAITADSLSPFTITASGAPVGFISTRNFSWEILSLGNGTISGFDASAFTLVNNITGATGTFSITSDGSALTLNYTGGAAQTVSWGNNNNTAWMSSANWGGSSIPGAGDVASFGANPSGGVGINLNDTSNNLGQGNQAIGAIEVTALRSTPLTISNSSGARSGVLTLIGATVNEVDNVVLRNNSGSDLTLANGATQTMGVVLDGAENVVVIDGAGNINISSSISGTGKSLTLTGAGAGVLTLSGANTYSGATLIESGTLALGSTGSIANSDRILVSSGATFDVSAVTSFTVGASQAIGGVGTIVGNMSLAADAGLIVFDLMTPLTVTGTVSLDSTFSIASLVGADGNAFDWTGVANGTYTLINGAGNFSSIQNFGSGNPASIGDGRFAFFKEGSLQVEVVPEPSTYALLVLAGAGLAAYRLRRRHRR